MSVCSRQPARTYLFQTQHMKVTIHIEHENRGLHTAKLSDAARDVSPGPLGRLRRVPAHNCRHMPQGLAGGEMFVATATALKSRCPSVTALPNATRSAHVPTG